MEEYLLLLFSLAVTFLLTSSMILDNSMIGLDNIDLSPVGLAKKVLTWGAEIILAILFVRKIKSMEKNNELMQLSQITY